MGWHAESDPAAVRTVQRAMKHLRVLAHLGLLVVALALAVRCTASPGAAVPPVDAAATDSATARPDARARDSGFVPPKAPAGWTWFSALGQACDGHFVPIDPEAALPKLTWKACATQPYASGAGACQEFDTTGWSYPDTPLQGKASVTHDGKYLALVRLRDDRTDVYSDEEAIYELASLRAVGGMRMEYARSDISSYVQGCQTAFHVLGRAEPTLLVYKPKLSFIVDTPKAIMEATSYRPMSPDYFPEKDLAQDVTTSDSLVAFTTFGGAVRMKRSDMTWVRAKRYTTVPLAVHDDVLAREDPPTRWYRLVRVEADGEVTIVREIADHHVFGAFYDGSMLYWIELSGTTNPRESQAHFELWRAPYTRDIPAFNASAQRVASADGLFNYGFSLVYDGVFATGVVGKALVVRLSDGRVKELTSASNVEAYPFYVDNKDLWIRYTVDRPADVHYGKVEIPW
jgi:hypothetical protein